MIINMPLKCDCDLFSVVNALLIVKCPPGIAKFWIDRWHQPTLGADLFWIDGLKSLCLEASILQVITLNWYVTVNRITHNFQM